MHIYIYIPNQYQLASSGFLQVVVSVNCIVAMWHCYLDVLSFIHNLFYWFNFFVLIFLYLCCSVALLQYSTVACSSFIFI